MPSAVTPPGAFTPLKGTALFKPLQLGSLALSHRIIQVWQELYLLYARN
jgi:hypothetical protein